MVGLSIPSHPRIQSGYGFELSLFFILFEVGVPKPNGKLNTSDINEKEEAGIVVSLRNSLTVIVRRPKAALTMSKGNWKTKRYGQW